MARPPVLYSLPRLYIGPCVYKLSFNDRYVIVKAKESHKSIEAIQKALNQFMRHSESQRKPQNLYYHFFSYVESKQEGIFTIETIKESDNPYELLKTEQESLWASVNDKKCLNNNTEAYIPEYNEETGMYGWIPKSSALNFQKWLKSHKGTTSI
jgi:hypothetical protein